MLVHRRSKNGMESMFLSHSRELHFGVRQTLEFAKFSYLPLTVSRAMLWGMDDVLVSIYSVVQPFATADDP